jgi:hypothetical protein
VGEFILAFLDKVMAVYQAFFDESGTHADSPIVAVAGAIGEAAQWQAKAAAWESVLSAHGVRSYHATDYNTKNGEFTAKRFDDEQRIHFSGELSDVLRSEPLFGVGAVMEVAEYEDESKNHPGVDLTPYQFLCYHCIVLAVKHYHNTSDASTMEVYFESGQRYTCDEIVNLRRLVCDPRFSNLNGIRVIDWISKNGMTSFQIADYIVYEQLKAHTRIKRGAPESPRYQAQELNRNMRGYVKRLDSARIKSALDKISDARA